MSRSTASGISARIARTAWRVHYDINALSNFVANAPEVVGFDPFVQLVDLIVARAAVQAGATVPA